MIICLERDADLHMAQLMPLPLTVSCSGKIQIVFTFLVPAHPGSPGKGPCVCVCQYNFVPLLGHLKRSAYCLHIVRLMPLHPKTQSSLASFKSRLVFTFLVLACTAVLEKRPLNWCSSSIMIILLKAFAVYSIVCDDAKSWASGILNQKSWYCTFAHNLFRFWPI